MNNFFFFKYRIFGYVVECCQMVTLPPPCRTKGPLSDGGLYHNYEYTLRKNSNAEATFATSATGGPEVHGRVVDDSGNVYLVHNDGGANHSWIAMGYDIYKTDDERIIAGQLVVP